MLKRILKQIIVLAIVAMAAGTFAQENNPPELNTARTWMYQIQGLEKERSLQELERSDYPMLVLEPGHNLKEYPYKTREMVQRLRYTPAGKRRILLAYVDIGQAEIYRNYWKNSWVAPTVSKRGKPDFLVGIDPDGWRGNYPVAYWYDNWKRIWLSPQAGIVRQLARFGFDGIYLDWVEAYDDDHVRQVAEEEDIDPEMEMIHFIEQLGSAGRQINNNFLVVPQNAPYLIDAAPNRYAAAVDALAVEDTWFHGKGDAEWDDPEAGDQRGRHFDEWSTENRLRQYKVFMDRGLPVFSVDYCLAEKNARLVYREARSAGLIPLVTRVSLSRMTETPPGRQPE